MKVEMSHLYTAWAIAVGGRSGTVRTDDGLLDLQLAMPKELGGKGGATNPEQLFVAGYAACFGNAVIHVTRTQTIKVRNNDIEVVGEISACIAHRQIETQRVITASALSAFFVG